MKTNNPDIASKEQTKQAPERRPNGTYKQGVSGNPSGRPKGAANRFLTLAREAALDLWPDVLAKAKNGDWEAVKVVLAIGTPKVRPIAEPEAVEIPADISLSNKLKAVQVAVLTGEISLQRGNEYVEFLCSTENKIKDAEKAEDVERFLSGFSS